MMRSSSQRAKIGTKYFAVYIPFIHRKIVDSVFSSQIQLVALGFSECVFYAAGRKSVTLVVFRILSSTLCGSLKVE